jgi:hypothetical protein
MAHTYLGESFRYHGGGLDLTRITKMKLPSPGGYRVGDSQKFGCTTLGDNFQAKR